MLPEAGFSPLVDPDDFGTTGSIEMVGAGNGDALTGIFATAGGGADIAMPGLFDAAGWPILVLVLVVEVDGTAP